MDKRNSNNRSANVPKPFLVRILPEDRKRFAEHGLNPDILDEHALYAYEHASDVSGKMFYVSLAFVERFHKPETPKERSAKRGKPHFVPTGDFCLSVTSTAVYVNRASFVDLGDFELFTASILKVLSSTKVLLHRSNADRGEQPSKPDSINE